MGNRKPLGFLIRKYAIFEIIYSAFIFLLALYLVRFALNRSIIYPANYAENHISEIDAMLTQDDFKTSNIPYFYDYEYTKNGNVIENTIDDKYSNYVKEAYKNGLSYIGSLLNPKFLKKLSAGDKTLILAYQISPILTSKNLYEKINNIEILYVLTIFTIWLIGFSLFIRKSVRLLKAEIEKISVTNSHIKDMDLDYKREKSKYREIYGVLNSLDTLSKELKRSLTDQWEAETSEKELLEEITHDIRTPITIIKGNTELLKEDIVESQIEYLNGIESGTTRLEIYIDKLKNFSKTLKTNPHPVDENAISYWIDIAETIMANKDINLVLSKRETSKIRLDKEQIASALQNLIVNATEHSKPYGNIYLSFENENNLFVISVKDEGDGFENEILESFPQKKLTSKKDKINHGFGLNIINQITKNNNGILEINNYSEKNNQGAVVKMKFKI